MNAPHASPKNGAHMFGFGCMRLPLTDKSDPASFDFKAIESLFDEFLRQGFCYFDTAYTYPGYECEKAVRRALVERHPRSSFMLATKMPLRDFKDAGDLERIFDEQLANCGVDFFDSYLLHNMGHNVYEKCRVHGAFDFVRRKKEEGKIISAGMSFHDTPELLESILGEYGSCLDFVQLQVNYIDWEQPSVQSRRCLEAAGRYGKPVTVMEPCKGGTLVNIPAEAEAILKEHAPDRSVASWAMRFAASQKGVERVLSGMNTLEQVRDNASTFGRFRPLDEAEYAVLRRVAEIIGRDAAIPCTGCSYCTHDCPKRIAVPEYFALFNSIRRTTGGFSSQQVYYNNTALSGHGKAGECLKCGKCEQACPQHLPIRSLLEEVAATFEGNSFFPTRARR